MNKWVEYLVMFVVFFIVIYILYYFFAIRPRVNIKKKNKSKKKKEQAILPEISLLQNYYMIDLEKIGILRVYKIINFVNALFLSLLVMVTVPFNAIWIKIIILVVLMIPSIWVTYYFLAKYLKHLERKC